MFWKALRILEPSIVAYVDKVCSPSFHSSFFALSIHIGTPVVGIDPLA
jgi:hypothetical protein